MIYYILTSVLFLFSCQNKKVNNELYDVILPTDSVPIKEVRIQLADNTNRNPVQTFDLQSCVRLSNQTLIGNITRTLVCKERIFILDDSPKIGCYNMDGELEYEINSQGESPEEFGTIVDFALDEISGIVWLYDSAKRHLSDYDMYTGKYKYCQSTSFMAPDRMAVNKGNFFFHTPDHYNYVNQPEMHYSLLYSVDGKQIDGRFFRHDETSEYRFGGGGGHPFYYSQGRLFCIRNFDNIVYELSAKKISPVFDIQLPNPLPIEYVKSKPNPMNIIKSNYSSMISECYVCQDMMSFQFTKSGSIYWVLYDLLNDTIVNAGKNQMDTELLVEAVFSGVYNDCFFSVVPAQVILWKKEKFPLSIPENLQTLTEEDNPVVAFYKVKR